LVIDLLPRPLWGKSELEPNVWKWHRADRR